ncbi:hypothetical protein [Desulfovibrio ferrophilus]|uniref:Uncharacterized protein n=1 Tax=Desulfovibrio ferrophilus TaxID=241368 RepID=A0A2Z6AX40_9BACT|nr:hypothetical protein [Desulfovibrio ferrophilus]BBD07716.1 uncharacterized protein DFE_0990 [Desulfovibrio ferrophilus]
MTIKEYLEKIEIKSQAIFKRSIQNIEYFGSANHFSTCISDFSSQINDINDKNMLAKVCSQLEYSYINLAYGMYRQAFSSLRLAMEMGLGAAFFSVHKLEQYEWVNGRADIIWSKLTDKNNGVLSKRYALAFFPELEGYIEEYNKKATSVYRQLSEYVHGNNETWGKNGLILTYQQDLVDLFFGYFKQVAEIILFVLSCRHLKSFSDIQADDLLFLREEMNHIAPIRELLGGPKE